MGRCGDGELQCGGVALWGSCGVGELRCGGVAAWVVSSGHHVKEPDRMVYSSS